MASATSARDRFAATLYPEQHPLLDLLDPAAFEVFQVMDAAADGLDRDRVGYLSGSGWPLKFSDTSFARVAAGFGDAELRAMGLWAQLRRFYAPNRPSWLWEIVDATIAMVARRKLAWPPDEVEVLWQTALTSRNRDTVYRDELRLPLAATERLDPGDRRRFAGCLHQAMPLLENLYIQSSAERHRLKNKVDRLLASIEDRTAQKQVADLISGQDEFAARLRANLGDQLTAVGVPALLRHWSGAVTAQPTATWTRQARELAVAAPGAVELVRTVLTWLPAHRERLVHHQTTYTRPGDGQEHLYDWTETLYLEQQTAVLLRGMVWSLEAVDAGWVVPLLGEVAVTTGTGIGGSGANARNELVANAAVTVLATRQEEGVVAQLARVQAKVRKRTILAGVAKVLDAAATRAGLSREQLLERTVPTFGLGPDGVRAQSVGEHTGLLVLDAAGAPALRFRNPAGRVVTSVPKVVRERQADLLAELRTAVKALKQALPAERLRVEGALADGRTWPVDAWRAFYLDHPVTGVFGRKLVWECSGDGGTTWTAGWPARDGDRWWLTDRTGRPLPGEGSATTMRLWHPIRATRNEVRAWREWLTDSETRQPFKQVYREVYLLTPAEAATRTYSNRFAAHVLKYGQAKALLQQRGWSGLQLGYWDGGYDGTAEKVLFDAATGIYWRSQFFVDLIDTGEADGYGTPSYCSSDQVRFHRHDGRVWRQAELAELPPLVLSEAMRDVDLAIGVASIAADPTWQDRGDTRHLTYWQQWSSGELTESAKVRREALARLMPRTKIADRVEVTDRFLRVRGDLRTYKIHLGSGNILMEPNDAYLCIVTSRDVTAERVFLPFEEDGGLLSVIVSKAFLLAADASITDPTIVRQIRG